MNSEEKNKKLISDLKNLPKIDAPSDFESKLWKEINLSVKQKKESFWDRVLSPAKLFPGIITVSTAIVIFFIVETSPEEMEDPLNQAPRIREDLIIIDEYSKPETIINQKTKEKTEENSGRIKKDIPLEQPQAQSVESFEGRNLSKSQSEILDEERKEVVQLSGAESLRTEESQLTEGAIYPAPVTEVSNEIKKDNLNFMQINLSAKERQQVEMLKQRIQTIEKPKSE